MKKFRYRLERILHLRDRQEREARRRLARAAADLAECRLALARAEEAGRELAAEGGRLVLAGKAAALPLQAALHAAAMSRGRALREQESILEEAAEAARQAWQAARRELRSLVLLRDREGQRWRAAANAEEGREMDEIGRQGFLRQRGEAS